MLKHCDLTEKLIGVFYDVYNELGFGFLESVYQTAMTIALRNKGIEVRTKVPVPVSFRGQVIATFEADVLVENAVLLELKGVQALVPAHEAQLLNYLRATPIEVGLLLNFGPKPQFKRLAFDNERKQLRPRINADERG
jgi:GxxExxY protein